MNYAKLRELNRQLYFCVEDVADILGIKLVSARVLCARYVKQGLLVRIKRNFYILKEKWQSTSQIEFFKIANFLQVPSYISFMTALNYYQVTTQVQRNYIESSCTRRTRTFEVEQTVFNYYRIKKEYYQNFKNENGLFVATKEKAFLDCVYLYSFGKYRFDIDSIDLKKIDIKTIESISKKYPEKTREVLKKICGI